jgi:hypothetical protein
MVRPRKRSASALDIEFEVNHTDAMQPSDGRFDGTPPDPYKPASWRGTLAMLIVIAALLALAAYVYLSIISAPGSPDMQLPIGLPF